MTAPVTMAPVGSPSTTTSDFVQDATSEAVKTTLIEQGADEKSLERDEHGRFKPREHVEETTQPASEGPAKGKDGKVEVKPVVSKPGDPVILPEADLTQLATSFLLKDDTGELTIPAGLKVVFKANGRDREETLDKVVRFAEMGVYNHEREQRRQATEQQARVVQGENQQFRTALQQRDDQLDRLLNDPSFYQRAVQEYQNQNTPEAQQHRLTEERRQLDVDRARMTVAPQHQRYMETEIVPTIDLMVRNLPHVTAEEIGARVSQYVQTLQGPMGFVDPSQYPAIHSHFLTEIVPYFRQLDDFRAMERGTPSGRQQAESATREQTKKQADLDAQRTRTQRVRRQAAQNLTPPGRGASGTPPASTTPVRHTDAVQDAIATALRQTFGHP